MKEVQRCTHWLVQDPLINLLFFLEFSWPDLTDPLPAVDAPPAISTLSIHEFYLN